MRMTFHPLPRSWRVTRRSRAMLVSRLQVYHAHFLNLAENHCGLRVIDWANDATIIPLLSELIRRTLGNRAVIRCETGLFKRLFPFWGISIIALLEPVPTFS